MPPLSGHRMPPRAGGPARRLVVLLHGVGANGDAGEVVPAAAMYAAVAGQQAAGIPVQWCLRRGLPHGIDPHGIGHGATFLAAALAESDA